MMSVDSFPYNKHNNSTNINFFNYKKYKHVIFSWIISKIIIFHKGNNKVSFPRMDEFVLSHSLSQVIEKHKNSYHLINLSTFLSNGGGYTTWLRLQSLSRLHFEAKPTATNASSHRHQLGCI